MNGTHNPAAVSESRVFLVRHAETAAPGVFHGAESDVGLSESGRRSVLSVIPVLAAEGPAVVVSSAQLRAVETARPIAAACGVELLIEPDLHERRLGALSGAPRPVAEVELAEVHRRWALGETGHAPEGGESFDQIRSRVLPAWERLAERFAGRSVVVVAHGMVIKVLLSSLFPSRGLARWIALRCPNLGIFELSRSQAGWNLLRPGDDGERPGVAHRTD